MALQTGIQLNTNPAYAGQIANPFEARTARGFAAGDNLLFFGEGAAYSTTDPKQVVTPYAAGMTIAEFAGLIIRNEYYENRVGGGMSIGEGDQLALLQIGDIWVPAVGAISINGPIFWVTQELTTGDGSIGKFTGTASGSGPTAKTVDVSSVMRPLSAVGSAGGLVKVSILKN